MSKHDIIQYLSLTGLFFTVGCTQLATLDYTPSTTAEIRGALSVSSFTDSRDSGIEGNEIDQINTVTGRNIYLTENVNDIVTTAVRREFRQAGISLRDAHCSLEGSVNKFSFETVLLGGSFKYFNDIHYILKGPTNVVLYDKDINVVYKAGIINLKALGNDLSQSLSNNINQLLTDVDFVSSIETNCK